MWTYRDASARSGCDALELAIIVTLVPPLVLYYLYRVLSGDLSTTTPENKTRFDTVIGVWAAASVPSILISLLIAPPDTVSLLTTLATLLVTLLVVLAAIAVIQSHQRTGSRS